MQSPTTILITPPCTPPITLPPREVLEQLFKQVNKMLMIEPVISDSKCPMDTATRKYEIRDAATEFPPKWLTRKEMEVKPWWGPDVEKAILIEDAKIMMRSKRGRQTRRYRNNKRKERKLQREERKEQEQCAVISK
jgi:hypothetical protein